ncbi:conserved hypothetical protein [Hahella chejuensis KCTC 2396]|uniref:Polysaccharide lyase n=1 Tax=Hahella chejuensis (strain KCTC 2396) TaxID=349521 RepID=Q2SGV1_HAHCH|nr:polysaccharide lyase [Hahella chejuensis]ABC30123.1 conserved hypothetical protein [Hahella chejuensis KCTC 2396]
MASKKSLIASAVLLGLFSTVSQAKILYQADFEHTNIKKYGNGSGNWPQISQKSEPSCDGDRSMKVELYFDQKKNKYNYRTELTNMQQFQFGKEYWVSFAAFIPKNWKNDGKYDDIIMQVHGTPDTNLGEHYRNPPLALSIQDGKWVVGVLADTRKLTPKPGKGVKKYTLSKKYDNIGAVNKGKWTTFVMQFKASPQKDGYLNVWVDGRQKVKHTGGIFFNDAKGPYFKAGLYKPGWKKGANWSGQMTVGGYRLHYFDALKIGDHKSSFKDMAVQCGS